MAVLVFSGKCVEFGVLFRSYSESAPFEHLYLPSAMGEGGMPVGRGIDLLAPKGLYFSILLSLTVLKQDHFLESKGRRLHHTTNG